jgi:hypothetical protein
MRLMIAIVAACWLSAGVAPLRDAVIGTLTPADFIRDYVTARDRLDRGPGAPPSAEEGNALAVRLGAPPVQLFGGPYYLHPPPSLLVVLPFAWMPWDVAAAAWALASLALLGWLAASLLAIASPSLPPQTLTARNTIVLTLALVLWPPTLYCLEKGQWSIATAAVLAAGCRAIERTQWTRAGVWFGTAVAIKATPIVLVVVLLACSRRAVGAMLATIGGATTLSVAVNGLAIWSEFFANAAHDAQVWAPWVTNTASMQGVYARLLTKGPFASPLVEAPLVSLAAFVITGVILLVAGTVTAPKRAWVGVPTAPGNRDWARWCAAWLVLPVALNPLGWSHVVLLLLAPLVVAFRDGNRNARMGCIAAFAALSVPRQTLAALAGPLPVAPGPGLLLGVHAVAAIALYVLLLRKLPSGVFSKSSIINLQSPIQ